MLPQIDESTEQQLHGEHARIDGPQAIGLRAIFFQSDAPQWVPQHAVVTSITLPARSVSGFLNISSISAGE